MMMNENDTATLRLYLCDAREQFARREQVPTLPSHHAEHCPSCNRWHAIPDAIDQEDLLPYARFTQRVLAAA